MDDLDEGTLIEIAELTGASYFRAIDTEALEGIYEELDALEPIEYEEETFVPATLLYHYPLAIALVLALTFNLGMSLRQLTSRKGTNEKNEADED